MQFRYCYGGLYVDAGWGSVVLPPASFTHACIGVSPGGSVGMTLGNVYVCFVNCLYELRDSGHVSLTGTLSGCPAGMDVDVTQDLLLVYNSSSTDSGTVKDYYLQHRPMVNGAMVMSISVPTINETILTNDITTLIVQPIADWLSTNGNKQPKYIVLFPNTPTRVNDFYSPFYLNENNTNFQYFQNANKHASVSVQIANAFSWKPYVTYISMGSVAACQAYIDKLEAMGKRYAQNHPGNVTISASGTGYSNGRYYFDDTRRSDEWNAPDYGYSARNGALNAGVSSTSITYSNTHEVVGDQLTYHISTGSDVSGYLCWGNHSNLGNSYATDGTVTWSDNSGWWVIETIESSNGERYQTDYANYTQWFQAGAFVGGLSYSATPVGAVTQVDEPGPYWGEVNNPSLYFGNWASGLNFATCAWGSRQTIFFAAFGDPLVTK